MQGSRLELLLRALVAALTPEQLEIAMSEIEDYRFKWRNIHTARCVAHDVEKFINDNKKPQIEEKGCRE